MNKIPNTILGRCKGLALALPGTTLYHALEPIPLLDSWYLYDPMYHFLELPVIKMVVERTFSQ